MWCIVKRDGIEHIVEPDGREIPLNVWLQWRATQRKIAARRRCQNNVIVSRRLDMLAHMQQLAASI